MSTIQGEAARRNIEDLESELHSAKTRIGTLEKRLSGQARHLILIHHSGMIETLNDQVVEGRVLIRSYVDYPHRAVAAAAEEHRLQAGYITREFRMSERHTAVDIWIEI